MQLIDLYIVAAGFGSRMDSALPKPLVPISDEPCLTTTLQQVGTKFRRVFLVSNVRAQKAWNAYFKSLQNSYPELARLVINLPIESGFGDGHATYQGILAAERLEGTVLDRDIVVIWGDVFLPSGQIVDELLSVSPSGSGILPAVRERNPYVSLVVNHSMQCEAAEFAKYGEIRETGLHDQSVFRFSAPMLKDSLLQLHRALWKNGRYITTGGELSLLYSFHHLFNNGTPVYVYETQYPTLTFNTPSEVAAIQREISARWWRSTSHNVVRKTVVTSFAGTEDREL